MHKEYIELYQTYTKKYGPKTAIFLMVGSFYELYDIQDVETGTTQANVREIVDYLGIQLSAKKGDVGPGKDGLFAGFPDYVMHKWAGRLTAANWTVVIVDQIKDARGKVKERKVSRILSPSTHIENAISTETPYIATIWVHTYTNQPPIIGAAVLDGTTGTTRTYSTTGKGRPDIWTADDMVQLLTVYPPKEVLIHWFASAAPDDAAMRRQFGLSSSITLHRRVHDTMGSFEHELVRGEYLQKIYAVKSVLPIRTYLGFRSLQEELALLYLLQFIEEHDTNLLQSLHRNETWNPNTTLVCGNHALTQLQMTSLSHPQDSVLGLFDKCLTVMGRRAIKERLLSPYSDGTTIRLRLKEIEEYTIWPEARIKTMERQLRFMFDLPRLHRKIHCGTVTSSELAGLFQTYDAIRIIRTEVTSKTSLEAPWSQEEESTYHAVFCKHVSEEKARMSSQDVSAFSSATYPDIAEKETQIQEVIEQIHQLRSRMAIAGHVQEDAIRIEEREKEPYGFKASSVTLQQLKKNIANLPEGTRISELKSGGWVECNALNQANTKMIKLRDGLEQLVRVHQLEVCHAISEAGQYLWSLMEQWVAHVDGTQCIARVSMERGWTCPIIHDNHESWLDIKQVRHPLVEASSTRVSYVKHDVRMGKSVTGWLLYGINASGKSTLMKATGLCVLLAQAGCYVPAQSMNLCPFQAVYTRILNHDNLAAGLSSFAVEMSELRDILRNANPHTLVLGDELCAGTESTSGQALVASGIQWLSKRHTKFMFATHLHGIPSMIDTQKENVEVWHLHVEYNYQTKKLVYDRSLRPGSGSTLYGLEVARAMDLPSEFIEQALENRHRIVGSVKQENAVASEWNPHIVKKACEICKSPIIKELEVHHISERHTATKGILPDGTHMNTASNLIVLCEECHHKVHHDTLRIGPMLQTSHGPERTVIHIEPEESESAAKPIKKGKWTDEEMETVRTTLRAYSSLSLKAVRAYLSSKYGIEMSETILTRIKKEL
jgi:DNA mismatch repair protein MutS